MDDLHMVLPYVMPNWSYIEYFEILKSDEILRSCLFFRQKRHWMLIMLSR